MAVFRRLRDAVLCGTVPFAGARACPRTRRFSKRSRSRLNTTDVVHTRAVSGRWSAVYSLRTNNGGAVEENTTFREMVSTKSRRSPPCRPINAEPFSRWFLSIDRCRPWSPNKKKPRTHATDRVYSVFKRPVERIVYRHSSGYAIAR